MLTDRSAWRRKILGSFLDLQRHFEIDFSAEIKKLSGIYLKRYTNYLLKAWYVQKISHIIKAQIWNARFE